MKLTSCRATAGQQNIAFRKIYQYDSVYPRVKIEGSVETTEEQIILQTNLSGIERFSQGKVRDVYGLGDRLLIVATDRISAFDWVLPTGIPDKGRVLTQMSAFWFDLLGEPNHLLTTEIDEVQLPEGVDRRPLAGRSMLVRKTDVVPIECVVRGYLSGSGWKEYRQGGTV